jgi:hypothetical protein
VADVFFLLALPVLLFFTVARLVVARPFVVRVLVAVGVAERAFGVLRFFVVALPGFRLDREADAVRGDLAASSAFRGPPPSTSATRSRMTPVAADAAAPSASDAASLTPSAPVLAALTTASWVLSNTLFLAISECPLHAQCIRRGYIYYESIRKALPDCQKFNRLVFTLTRLRAKASQRDPRVTGAPSSLRDFSMKAWESP